MITNTMFNSIKSALAADADQNKSNLNDILQLKVGNTYTVRLLPYGKDPSKTFYHYFQHGWTSFLTGQYVTAISLQTVGERDPIAERRYKLSRAGTPEEQEKAKSITRVERWLVNVLVVNDPVNPDNNGKVKILRYGKQLQKIISEAIEGEEAEDFGPRIFDLSPNGVNLRIKVEKQGDYPSYVSSKFSMPCAVEGIDEDDIDQIIKEKTFDLTTFFNLKSYADLEKMFDEHFTCKAEDRDEQSSEEDSQPPEAVKKSSKPAKQESSDDEALKELLDGLDL